MTTPAPLDAGRAEELASLLQADLAAAGHTVPHSLAVGLVAHQQAAPAPAGYRPETQHASTGPLEWETVEQNTTAMTVSELRAAIEDLPAHLQVVVSQPTEPGADASRTLLPATAV